MATVEQRAREEIDELLAAAGWVVQNVTQADIRATRGDAVREFPLLSSTSTSARAGRGDGGFGDYLLYIDGKAAGVIEAKAVGATLTSVEIQSAKYAKGLLLPSPRGAVRSHLSINRRLGGVPGNVLCARFRPLSF